MMIEDEIFGKLSLIEASQHEQSYLLGAKLFSPLNYEVEYNIYTVNKIVSKNQREFLIEIEKRYAVLKNQIEKFINSEIKKIDTKSKNYTLENDLKLCLISIPESIDLEVEWSIEYALNKDFAFFTVEFKDWEPFWLSISA
ncbi:hypothetical protein ESA94_19445 [Lacibacter luteus]|uniref:DUF2262 domain-containing protein n=1 Tax=Lacibacter luteus TaxID=2508719 RepID=A0A4Q1CE19_9BACT|nr:hypothetical protein [Lacibacter luteus]RXK57702.1 hypothetical protein ESA94_19445 [Lacibacter luteus]